MLLSAAVVAAEVVVADAVADFVVVARRVVVASLRLPVVERDIEEEVVTFDSPPITSLAGVLLEGLGFD